MTARPTTASAAAESHCFSDESSFRAARRSSSLTVVNRVSLAGGAPGTEPSRPAYRSRKPCPSFCRPAFPEPCGWTGVLPGPSPAWRRRWPGDTRRCRRRRQSAPSDSLVDWRFRSWRRRAALRRRRGGASLAGAEQGIADARFQRQAVLHRPQAVGDGQRRWIPLARIFFEELLNNLFEFFGRVGARRRTGRGGSFCSAAITSTIDLAANGARRPAQQCIEHAAGAYRSQRLVTCLPSACSGAM